MRLFSLLPKGLIAFLAIAAGMAFIILSEPPHTICDSQLEVFRAAQKSFLFLDPKKKTMKTTKFNELRDHCKLTNNPGGCYELFQEMKIMLRDLDAVPSDCAEVVGQVPEVKNALWKTTELMVELGWGEKPPSTYYQKFGWLDKSDISLFCQLKSRINRVYGEQAWISFRERMFTSLPKAKELSRNQVWDMSILSENCARYP